MTSIIQISTLFFFLLAEVLLLSELKSYETEVTDSVFLDRQCLTLRKQREAMGTERRIQEQNTEEVQFTINEETDKVREQIFAWLDFSSVYKGETFQVQAIFLQIKVHKCTKRRIS